MPIESEVGRCTPAVILTNLGSALEKLPPGESRLVSGERAKKVEGKRNVPGELNRYRFFWGSSADRLRGRPTTDDELLQSCLPLRVNGC